MEGATEVKEPAIGQGVDYQARSSLAEQKRVYVETLARTADSRP